MPDSPIRQNLEEALAELPVFPLPDVVLFPNAVLPLHVFEPRYQRMLSDCLAAHGALAIAHIVDGDDAWGQPRIASISGGGIVLRHQPLTGGRSNILVLGQARLALEELPPDDDIPYRRARATIVAGSEGHVSGNDKAALVGMAMTFVTEVRRHDPGFGFSLPAGLSAADIADACACQLVADGAMRQEILEDLVPTSRVERVTHQLAIQLAAMREDGVVLS